MNGAGKAAIVHISVKFADGSAVNVSSSAGGGGHGMIAGWTATTTNNPVTYSHLFHGEIYDARKEEEVTSLPLSLAVSLSLPPSLVLCRWFFVSRSI